MRVRDSATDNTRDTALPAKLREPIACACRVIKSTVRTYRALGYEFTAKNPGTFFYHCHVQPDVNLLATCSSYSRAPIFFGTGQLPASRAIPARP